MLIAGAAVAMAAAAGWLWRARHDSAAFAAQYDALPPRPPGSVYHLGHSLVGRDMPAMLAQMMGSGYRYNSQLGWGASLNQHRAGDVPGHAEENATPAYRAAEAAIGSGDYDAVVLTEMVELRDALRWHDSAVALAHWTALARAARPDVRVYLYETWHRLDDPQGWLSRLDADLPELWEPLVAEAMADPATGSIHIIPAGQAMAALVRRIEAGEVPGLTNRQDLFARDAAGEVDPIHLNDLGAYVVALVHYAVLSGASPLGLPHRLNLADGTPATAPPDAAAPIIQAVVWDAVRGYAPSGVSG
ncbi:hypothetical protein [Gemmobacter sp. LW-1]|uniref:hypothetical protein n=1 Tax=Gemmobacter sp. LW-1 TaxID=1529005 RepID=UPI001F19BEEB|nr:hypothetical protein [Gemmobacter sp. LW-1]